MILLSYSLTLYGFIITMDVVQGYILFAANIEDLKKIAKLIAPNNFDKVSRQIPMNTDDLRKIKNEEDDKKVTNNKRFKNKKVIYAKSDSRDKVKRTSDFKEFQDANQHLIYHLAEKIKQRVMKELILKFLRSKHEREHRGHLKKTEIKPTKVQHEHHKNEEVDTKSITDDDETVIILEPTEVSTEIVNTETSTSTRKFMKQAKHFNNDINSPKIILPYEKITKQEYTTTGYVDNTEKYPTPDLLQAYLKPMKTDTRENISDKDKYLAKHQKIAGSDGRMNKINFYKQLAKKQTGSDKTWSVGARKLTVNPKPPKTFVKLVNDVGDDHENNFDGGKHKKGYKIENLINLDKATRFEIKNKNRELKEKKHEKTGKQNDDANNDGSGEVEATTSYLWFDDNINDTIVTPAWDGKSDIIRNTMKPTLKMFSMATPNYYGSLPTVAERYNFKEPIPERDRKRKGKRWVKKYP